MTGQYNIVLYRSGISICSVQDSAVQYMYSPFNKLYLFLDNPSKYHIYEGLSTLTNISRYDLPDPDTYRSNTGLSSKDETVKTT